MTWFLVALSFVVSSVAVSASERVDVFDEQGRRQGYAITDERSGRVDLFDRDSRRTGYGVRRPDGSWDVYNLDGSRKATITPGIGGQPGRIIVPKGTK